MAAKQQNPIIFTDAAVLAYAFLKEPDTKAPEGAAFKPDGKYKGTLVYDGGTDFSALEKRCLAWAKEVLGDVGDVEAFHYPWKSGDGHRNEEMHGKILLTAKSQFQPEFVDGRGTKLPAGVYPRSGDTAVFKVALVPFKKTEKVREGKKMVDVDLYGVTARLFGVQIVKKSQGGGEGGWGAVEGGYEADEADAARAESQQSKPARNTRPQSGDGSDF